MKTRAALALLAAVALLGVTPLGGVLTQVIADVLYAKTAGGSIITAAHATDHLTFKMTGDSTGYMKINDFYYNSVPTTFHPALEGKAGHTANPALAFYGLAGDQFAAVPVFVFVATNRGSTGAPTTNMLFAVDSWDKRKLYLDASGRMHIGEGTAAITDMLQVDGDVRLSTGMVRQHTYVNPAGASGCDTSAEVGALRYMNPAADAGYRVCQCVCTQTGAATFAWTAVTLAGACTASTDC